MHIEAADPKHQSAYRPFSWPVTKRGWNIIAAPATTRTPGWRNCCGMPPGRNLPEGWVPCRTWFLINGQSEIIGAVRQRLGTAR